MGLGRLYTSVALHIWTPVPSKLHLLCLGTWKVACGYLWGVGGSYMLFSPVLSALTAVFGLHLMSLNQIYLAVSVLGGYGETPCLFCSK